jgi:hypothetical protein
MNAAIILGVLAGVPVVLALIRRVSAVLLFLSVAGGSLLVTHLSDDATLVSRMVSRSANVPMITSIVLLVLPVLLTLLLLKKTMPRSKLLLHIIPLLATGLSLAVLALPLLPSHMQAELFAAPYGAPLKNSQDLVIGGTTVLVLLLMLIAHRHKEDKGKKR